MQQEGDKRRLEEVLDEIVLNENEFLILKPGDEVFDVAGLSGPGIPVEQDDPRLIFRQGLCDDRVHICEIIVVKLIDIDRSKINRVDILGIKAAVACHQYLETRQFLRSIGRTQAVIGFQNPLLHLGLIQVV